MISDFRHIRAFLALARVNGVRGDPVVAARWYRRARDLGNPEAEILLKEPARKLKK